MGTKRVCVLHRKRQETTVRSKLQTLSLCSRVSTSNFDAGKQQKIRLLTMIAKIH